MKQQLQPFEFASNVLTRLQFSSSRRSFTSALKYRRYSMRMILQFQSLKVCMGPVCKDNEPGIVCSKQHCGEIPCCLCLSSRRNILHRNETWIVSESSFGPAKRIKKGMEWNSHIMSKLTDTKRRTHTFGVNECARNIYCNTKNH